MFLVSKKFTPLSFITFYVYFLIILFSLINFILYKNDFKFDNSQIHLVLYSTFYYKTSKLYAPNSMVMLLDASHEKTKPKMSLIQCVSKNETNTQTSEALIRMAYSVSIECKWEFFIANCTTVENPTYFGLTSTNMLYNIPIKYELPVAEKYPVVMCYPPMVYEGRWQQIVFAIEIYKYYGADLQIQYVNSAMKEIIDLLEVYVFQGTVKIEKFVFPDLDAETIASIGVNPMHELNFRNQPLALTDCLMRYRESSEFVIIADVDDVFFPSRKTYFDEFSSWSNIYPKASAFIYYRQPARISIEDNFESFSLYETIKSLRTNETLDFGKSIYQTKNVETAWIHWPSLNYNSSVFEIPPANGSIFHIKIFENSNLQPEYENTYKPFTNIPEEDIKALDSNFKSMFANFPKTLKSNLIYADLIFKCYNGYSSWNINHPNIIKPCLTPLTCDLPKIVEGFKCKVARRNYKSENLNNNLVLHFPNSDYYWWENQNGCKIFLNSKS